MSASQTTTNLGLPIFAETDFTDWADYNSAMQTIDTFAGTQKTASETLQTTVENNSNAIDSINDTLTTATTDLSTLQASVNGLNTTVGNISKNVNTLTTNVAGLSTDVENLTNQVGNLPDDLSQTITDLQTKNASQDTQIATAQSEANAASQAANEAVSAANFYQNSEYNSFAVDKITYYDGSTYAAVPQASAQSARIVCNWLSNTAANMSNVSGLRSIHGTLWFKCSTFSIQGQSASNPGFRITNGNPSTPLLAGLIQYIQAQTTKRGSAFSLEGVLTDSNSSVIYPVSVGVNTLGNLQIMINAELDVTSITLGGNITITF